MRNAMQCVKCGSSEVVVVPGTLGHGRAIHWGITGFDGWTPIARHVCTACGYTEAWIENPRDLAKIKKRFSSQEDQEDVQL